MIPFFVLVRSSAQMDPHPDPPPFRGRECTARVATALASAQTISALRDEFGDEVGAETLDSALAAVAGFLDAAERRLRRRDRDRIDADHAALERVADRGGGRV